MQYNYSNENKGDIKMNNKCKILGVVSLLFVLIIGVFWVSDAEDRNFKFDGDVVIFYPQHQDDEVLWASGVMKLALKTKGRDNVYVVLNSTGLGVNVFNDSKYDNLTKLEKKAIRDNEFKSALNKIGVKKENIVIISDIIGINGNAFEYMKKYAVDMEHKYKSVTHIAHSYKYDNHSKHLENGQTIKDLYDKKLIKNAIFFVKPDYKHKVHHLTKIKTHDKQDLEDIVKACDEYKPKPNDSLSGVGYISSPKYFKELYSDKNKTTYLHGVEE